MIGVERKIPEISQRELDSFSKAIEREFQKEIPEAKFQMFVARPSDPFVLRRVARISFDIEIKETNPDAMAAEIGLFWKRLRNEIELEIENY
jgi:hypothetical protein